MVVCLHGSTGIQMSLKQKSLRQIVDIDLEFYLASDVNKSIAKLKKVIKSKCLVSPCAHCEVTMDIIEEILGGVEND